MKALNVFAIILAWILSIALVVMLIAAPLALSALSMLSPDNIVEIVGQVMVDSAASAAAQPREIYTVKTLSAEAETTEESANDNVTDGLMQSIQGIVGDEVSAELVDKVLTSDAMSELLGAYTQDIANAFVGKEGQQQFTPELVVKVVHENLDEIVEILEESGTPLTEEEKEAFKSQLQTAVEENAEKIVEEMPTPEEVKESLLSNNEEMALAFAVLAKKNQIKGAIVGIIVLLSALIFGLRYPGLRGMRWLSTNLFTAGGFNVLVSVVLGLSASAVKGAATGINAMDASPVEGIIGMMLDQLFKGVIIRTAIIFVAAIVLLIGYILLKPFVRKKKTVKAEEPAVEEIVPETVPAVDAAPVAVEQEVVAEEAAEEQSAEEPTPAEEI